ncbi:MAG: prepilin-type N-terminal cleavage/methylation domain-containing protein [Planctomycetaceae bacterium]
MRHLNLKSTSHRYGFTMLELTVAASLLGMVFVVTLPLLKHVRVSRDAAQQRFVAQQEVANLMEQIAAPALGHRRSPMRVSPSPPKRLLICTMLRSPSPASPPRTTCNR